MTASNPYSTIAEKEFLETLRSLTLGASEEQKSKRIEALEELQTRIASSSIHDKNGLIKILSDMAKEQGDNHPETRLISESFALLIRMDRETLKAFLDGLEVQEDKAKEGRLHVCVAQVVSSLGLDQKGQILNRLVRFLMTREGLTDVGVKEVYDCLISLGDGKLSQEIVKESLPYLNSPPLRLVAIIYSVKLCATFADGKLAPDMLRVLDKSMKGYFDGHYTGIERDICQFLERVADQQSLSLWLKLLRKRSNEPLDHIAKVIAKVLDAYPNHVDDVLEMLQEDLSRNVADALIQSLARMREPKVDPRRLLRSIHLDWNSYPTDIYMQELFVKMGKLSKPALFDLLLEKEKHVFALRCLQEIGVSREEISKIFPKPPMSQVYDYCFAGRKKNPRSLPEMWKDKSNLGREVPGKLTLLEHVLLSIFACFNFVTLHVDSAGEQTQGIDLVCFYPETLDLFVIGCTTGVLKDDLSKIDLTVKKMKADLAGLFNTCELTSIVVTSEPVTISTSVSQFAAENRIVIMQSQHIDTLLAMLVTNRQGKEVVDYVKYVHPSDNSRSRAVLQP